jgi:hypothetical protein
MGNDTGKGGPMNCGEFERVLADYLEGARNDEHQAHLDSCSSCSGLLADLNFITSKAVSLQGCEEPSPRVWNALEIQLRREGLIRPAGPSTPPLTDFFYNWRRAWLVPVAAVLAIAAGVKLYHPARIGDNSPIAKSAPAATTPVASQLVVSPEDREVLSQVASRLPAQRASYRANLDDANAFIRDAEESARENPNDVYVQRMLVDAYGQKQMLYDLAVDRSYGEQ